jgi:hypothetical protein
LTSHLRIFLLCYSYDATADSVDFVAVLKYTSAAEADCIQVGKFNFFGGDGERCNNYFDWPANWNANAGNGTYSALIDVSSANYEFAPGDYTICFGDGNVASTVEKFVGTASFPNLISENSPIEVTSEWGETLDVAFDLAFNGGQYVCVETWAKGVVQAFNASIFFTTTNPAQTSLDFVAVIKYAAAQPGHCIQIGKYSFFGGDGERCDNYFDWPSEWNKNASSGKVFNAYVDVSSANYQEPEGFYEVCFGDGNTDSSYETFVGDVSYPGLTSEPQQTLVIASAYGETLDAAFDVTFTGGDYRCITSYAQGGLISTVQANVLFSTEDASQTSVDFVTVIKYTTNEVANCIQVGKFNFLGGNPERCNHYFDWPSDWNSGAVSGTTYTAAVDVTSAGYDFPDGDYTVR